MKMEKKLPRKLSGDMWPMPLRDIRGQDRVIESIKRALESERFSHAYIFLGPEGAGRHKTAKEFVKLLNCDLQTNDNCGECPSCVMIEKRSHPNVFFIEKEAGKKNISINDIRVLQHRFSLKPLKGRFNAAVIDAQDLTEEASNSILKILEEPLPHTIFILIASARKALLDTIVSRCQIMRFRPLSQTDAACILTENFNIEKKEALFLSSLSGNNVQRALLFRDADAVSWKNNVIDIFLPDSAMSLGENIISDNPIFDNEQLCGILMGFYRDVLVYKYTNKNDLLINKDRLKDIEVISEKADSADILIKIGYIEEAKRAFSANANLKLTLNLLKERLSCIT
jgi:DNA polymerase III subunit delta'